MPTIDFEGVNIAYQDRGSGQPVVMLHSSVSSGSQWRGFAADHGERFRVVAPDLYGYGATDAWRGHGPLRLTHEARLVEAVIDRIGEPVHLVGHSYGGAVALKIAAERPSRLLSLTLIEPVAFHLLWHSDPARTGGFGEIRRLAEFVSAAIAQGDRTRAMTRFVDYWNGAGAWQQIDERQRAAILQVAPKVPLDFWATIAEPKLITDYARVLLPTLLIAGDRSPAPARRIVELLGEALPRAEVEIVPGAGHMLPLTHADSVNPLIAGHLLGTREITREAA